MSLLRDRLTRLTSNPLDVPNKVNKPTDNGVEWEKFGARTVHNEWGPFIVRKLTFPLAYRHGKYRIEQLVEQAGILSLLNPFGAVHHESILFFDTETTGLGSGAGNVPFMIGIGYYQAQQYIIEQLLIRNPSEEFAMLKYLQQKLQLFTHVVSYNGRAFDWPLLLNRFILNRIPFEQGKLQQLDFLHPARSLWRNMLPSCRLGIVEEHRLGIARSDDVSGALVPAKYFHYLDVGDPIILEGVFRHNEVDIMSLAVLAIHFSELLQEQFQLTSMEAEEVYRLGLWFDKLGKGTTAIKLFEHLASRSWECNHAYLSPLAAIYKKKKNDEQAVMLWQRMIDHERQGSIVCLEPFIELAMYYEHRQKDTEKAIHYAKAALDRAWRKVILSRGDYRHRVVYESLQKRMNRLQRKWLVGRESKGEAYGDRETGFVNRSGRNDIQG